MPPEAIVPNDPEVLNAKNPVAIESTDAGVQTRRLGDMKASTFWFLLVLISIIVIGATIGGAVGGSIAARKYHPAETVTQAVSTRYI